MTPLYDLVVENGLFFDGRGGAPSPRHVAVKDGKVARVSAEPFGAGTARERIDARGCWVTPGFIDFHTHYDAEVELGPALPESLRHGVTTVVIGSCSLGLTPGTPELLSDIFCRVEAIPEEVVRPALERVKTWTGVTDYLQHLASLPLGPNIAAFLGHSPVRAHVMGVERSLDPSARATPAELGAQAALLSEALDAGYLGLSVQTSPWDKMGGDRAYRSRALPSYYASWKEYRALAAVLRKRGAILQAVPDLTTRVNLLLFLLESAGLWRRALKTTVISMMDIRSDRTVYRLCGWLSRLANRWLGADFKWQSLPEPFDLWADGMDLVVFEEFGAGAAALHFRGHAERSRLLKDPAYRKAFKKQWRSRFLPKAFHRNFDLAVVLSCPEPALAGRSFGDIARERGQDAVDLFLDLVGEHGSALRWSTVMGNDRPEALRRILAHPDVLLGFSDAGAHLRNMAHYNFPLRLLRLVRSSEKEGRPFLTPGAAVAKATGELGRWLGLDAGLLAVGRRADLVILDPEALDGPEPEEVHEEPIPWAGGLRRLVRRNDAAVRRVLVNGRTAVKDGVPISEVGRERGFGRLLRRGES